MKANQPSSQWTLQETSSGTTLVDPAGRTIAVAPDNQFESSRNLQALADLLNALGGMGSGMGVSPMNHGQDAHATDHGQDARATPPAGQLRHLAQLLEKLSTGPFNLPLDQMMRLTNDLLAWRDYVQTLADKIDSVAWASRP